MLRNTLEPFLYWRSDTRPPDVIFANGFEPLNPSQNPHWWKDSIRVSPIDGVPDSFPEKCISASTIFCGAAVFPASTPNLYDETQNQVDYTYIYAIALPKAARITNEKELLADDNAIPENSKDIPIDLNAFQFNNLCNEQSLPTSSETDKKYVSKASRTLYVFETIFSSVAAHNIIGAVRIKRGAQCLEFYQNSPNSPFYVANTRKFVIEPDLFVNNKFKPTQELAIVSKQQVNKVSIDYSLCQNQAIRFMKKASRDEVWQASRLSYGLMGKTLIFGKRVAASLFPPLNETKILKEIGLFKAEDLQFCDEDEEVNKILLAQKKKK